jgi:hypothetical protein
MWHGIPRSYLNCYLIISQMLMWIITPLKGITTQQLLHHEVDGNSNGLGIITKDLFVMKHRWLIMYSNL